MEAVSKKYIKPIYPNSSSTGGNTNIESTNTTTAMNSDEKEVFDSINNQ